jgi:cysteinyl-tRNA synthetase, unknown class
MKSRRNCIVAIFQGMVLFTILLSCNENKNKDKEDFPSDFRQEMREFVVGISSYAKANHPGFLVIPQNGIELILNGTDNNDSLNCSYVNAIDGLGQEDLFFGYNNDDEQTPANETDYLKQILNKASQVGKKILVTDYCSSLSFVDHSYNVNKTAGYISFAADHRGLDNIPSYPIRPYGENALVIDTLEKAKNFLYLIDLVNFTSKQQFIDAVTATNYDVLITDLFLNDSIAFNADDIYSLRAKKNNGKRMVICYMSIGEAENYRYYWNKSWSSNKPSWLLEENTDWEGNFKVQYWNPEWQDIIYGTSNAYLTKILDSGFDGVYLDIVDGYEYFE